MLVVLFRKSDSLCFVVVVSLSFVVVPLEDHLDEEGVVEGGDLPLEDDEVEDRAIEADKLVRDRFREARRRLFVLDDPDVIGPIAVVCELRFEIANL